MAKGFKLQIALASLRFCRSKKSFSMPKSPSSSNHIIKSVNPKTFDISYPKLPAPPPSTPDHPSSKSTNLSKVLSFGSSSGYLSERSIDYEDNIDPYKIEIYNSKDLATSFTMSFSSNESNDCLSGEEYDDDNQQQNEKETEGLLLSSCSSLDSSYDFGYCSTKNTYGSKRKKKNAKTRRRTSNYASNDQRITVAARPETVAVRKNNVFGRLMKCGAGGKVNESYAVMKRSSDPYEDFKKSMMEMILENQISEPEELEKLLMCYLSLNTRKHHAVIVGAFTEVWDELFCKSELWLEER
ncbi:hypothetical protein M9H77_24838 [Catharanthus roseus]|uniref:Uncharacterized protein n=1 Tax=Catharanthus roseus TaxID=4058 RepID=A0ACC0A712_CATRO|nr:hypothetical protein M9H77_24838 [Catharanthus roseus]